MRSFTAVVALLPAIALAAPSPRTCSPTDTFLAAGAKVVSESSLRMHSHIHPTFLLAQLYVYSFIFLECHS